MCGQKNTATNKRLKLTKRGNDGESAFRGCGIRIDGLDRHCNDCENEWNKKIIIND